MAMELYASGREVALSKKFTFSEAVIKGASHSLLLIK